MTIHISALTLLSAIALGLPSLSIPPASAPSTTETYLWQGGDILGLSEGYGPLSQFVETEPSPSETKGMGQVDSAT